MRDKQLMQVVLALNLVLVGAGAAYLLVSNYNQPAPVLSRLPQPAVNPANPAPPRDPLHAPPAAATPTNLSKPAPSDPSPTPPPPVEPRQAVAAAEAAPPPPARVSPSGKVFTWEDVETPAYRAYMANLRVCGCPEATVRRIVLDDVDELFARRRLKIAEVNDPDWWRPESHYTMSALPHLLRENAQQLEVDRRELITELLGPDVAREARLEVNFWESVQLTGSVLGRLSPGKHAAVQAICGDSVERQEAALQERTRAGQILNPVESARLRQQTREELRRVLNEEEMEEFLLRYSQNASRLREDLRGFNPTAEEFRRILAATDPIDHALQLQYGGLEALSTNQRERWQRQRDQAIQEVLSPERYTVFLLTKDPLFRQAQLYATQYGAPPQAVQPIYEMTKAVEGRRQEIMNNSQLSPQEKSQALQEANLEQHRNIQRIVREVHEHGRLTGAQRTSP